jgi:hypothetical protein
MKLPLNFQKIALLEIRYGKDQSLPCWNKNGDIAGGIASA